MVIINKNSLIIQLLIIYLILLHICDGKAVFNIEKTLKEKQEIDIEKDLESLNEDEAEPQINVLEREQVELNSPEDNVIEVAPPKHLDAVKFRRDGNLNSNFHKEVFLGEDIEKFANGDYAIKEQKVKLKEIFNLIDLDGDKEISVDELSAWVLLKTKEHFDEAKQENDIKFKKLHIDENGRLTWNEYLTEFLVQKGLNREFVADNLMNKVQIEIDEELKDEIDDIRNEWLQAASEDAEDDSLSSEEFLDFQHPEASKGMLAYMVEDFMHDMDSDADGILSIQEYMAIGSDVDADTQDDNWGRERREEFRNIIDADSNGKVTKTELEVYLNPLSEGMSQQEARQLILFGDENLNNKLSLDEILENSEYYTGSKLYNYALSVHEEF